MDIKSLQMDFRGEILTPGSAEYEVSRRIWNAMIDRRPAAIARCNGPADVLAAIRPVQSFPRGHSQTKRESCRHGKSKGTTALVIFIMHDAP